MQQVIRNRVESYSMSIVKDSSGLMHLTKEMNRGVTGIKTVEVPGEFFNTIVMHHLMLGTGETSRRKERMHALHKITPNTLFIGNRYRRDSDIYTYGAKKYLTNLKNHMNMNLTRFMIRSVFALDPCLFRKAIDGSPSMASRTIVRTNRRSNSSTRRPRTGA